MALAIARRQHAGSEVGANAALQESTNAMPVDIVADVVTKMAGKGHLFEAARTLEFAAHERSIAALTGLGNDARSFCGAIFDYYGLDRVRMTEALMSEDGKQTSPEAVPTDAPKTLFDDTENRRT